MTNRYNPNPYEQAESPRCSACDEQMTEVTFISSALDYWECQNQDCEECCVRLKPVADANKSEVGKLF